MDNKIENDIKNEDWFKYFIEECKVIIVESAFTARWAIIEGWWLLGKRICEETHNFERAKIYGKQITQRVAESLNRSPRTIEYAIAFYKRYNELDLFPGGKNISWRGIIRTYLTGPTDEECKDIESKPLPANIQLIHSDFKKFYIEPESVDLILTDPPYERKSLPLWDDLGAYGKRVLKPGGYLAAYSGHLYMKEVLCSLSKYLSYFWTFDLQLPGSKDLFDGLMVISEWKPIFIFYKPPLKKPPHVIYDVIVSNKREKDLHEWQQSEDGVDKLVEYFSQKGDTVLDPLSGTGTFAKVAYKLGRNAVGIEIDKTTYLNAKKRILSFVQSKQKESCSANTNTVENPTNKLLKADSSNIDTGQGGKTYDALVQESHRRF